MNMPKRIGRILLALAVAVVCLEVGETFTADFGYASPAEARVGRPLTPVSVAGVGRRTVRRCAAGVYYC